MAFKKRRPQPGGDCGASEKVLADGFDCLRDSPRNSKKQEHRHRADFARAAVYSEFGRNAFAIDQADFEDKKAWMLRQRRAPEI